MRSGEGAAIAAGVASYVDLLTCLQMTDVAKSLTTATPLKGASKKRSAKIDQGETGTALSGCAQPAIGTAGVAWLNPTTQHVSGTDPKKLARPERFERPTLRFVV